MWGHDLGWWGFVLAITTLVLAYPLDVLAHLTSPKVRDWWASRSQAALVRRITKLKDELSKIEKNALISRTEEELFRGIESTLSMAWSVGYFVLGGMAFVFWDLAPQNARGRWSLPVGLVLFVVFLTWAYRRDKRKIRDYRSMRSTRYKCSVEKDITKLEVELSNRQRK